jgi:toxin YoeB
VRNIHFDPDAWDDLLYWPGADPKIATRTARLIGDIQRDPFTGTAKPKPLKGDLSGSGSRRIDDERLVTNAGLATQKSRSSRRATTTATKQKAKSPTDQARRGGSRLL